MNGDAIAEINKKAELVTKEKKKVKIEDKKVEKSGLDEKDDSRHDIEPSVEIEKQAKCGARYSGEAIYKRKKAVDKEPKYRKK